MRHYETMFIIKPTLVEEEIKAKIDFFKEVITKNGGTIQTCLDMGMRNLAYQIKKQSRGYYFVIYFMANPELTFELERLYRINEDILRFIIIKYESKKDQKIWQSLVNRADRKEKPKSLKKDDDRGDRERRSEHRERVGEGEAKDFAKDFEEAKDLSQNPSENLPSETSGKDSGSEEVQG